MIWGDYNSAKAMQLSVRFKMCEGETWCESEENIRKWLKQKYIVILYNQVNFEHNKFHQDSFKEESRLSYIPISSQTK